MTASPRPDTRQKLDGSVVFGTDLEAPGMLWAAFVPAPVAHGRVRSVDLAPARALEGVVAVGAADLSALLPGATGDPDRPLFPTETVSYRSQPVAAVAAPTRELARQAARAVRVEVEPLPIVSDLEDVFPEWPGPAADASPHGSLTYGPATGTWRRSSRAPRPSSGRRTGRRASIRSRWSRMPVSRR